MSGSTSRASAALAGCAVAVLLCACGGGASGPESASHSKPRDEAQAKQGKAQDRGTFGGGSAPKAEMGAAPDDSSPDRGAKGCPNGMSERLCAQVAAIRKQQADNPPPPETGAGKCPAAMSRSVCKAVTRAYEEGQGSGSAPEPGKCPPTLSPTQCAELAKAYAEATK